MLMLHRKILSENKLEQETLDAQNAELERQRRLQELKKQQLAALLATEKEPKKEKDSQLKSLLQGESDKSQVNNTLVRATCGCCHKCHLDKQTQGCH